MNTYWSYTTRLGEARIASVRGKWEATLGGEFIGGGYLSAQQALDDFAGDHGFSHPSCADTSTLGLPEEIAEWRLVKN